MIGVEKTAKRSLSKVALEGAGCAFCMFSPFSHLFSEFSEVSGWNTPEWCCSIYGIIDHWISFWSHLIVNPASIHVLPQPQTIVLFLPLSTRCLHWPLPQMWCWTAIGSFQFSMFWINFTASFTSASLAVQRIRFVVMCLNMKIW